MTHKNITVADVNNFAWFKYKKEAMAYARRLKREFHTVYCGGERSQSRQNYLDMKIAAIYHNKWSGSSMPWVVGWYEHH